MIRNYIVVFIGGGLGASLRYWLSSLIPKWTGSSFPYGILSVNIIGCFFIGLIMTATEEHYLISPTLRVFLTIGILGGFTTFSTFSYETLAMLRDGELLNASIYVGLSLLFGFSGTMIGSTIGKLI